MTDLRRVLSRLQRPRLLIRAARHGQTDYRRDRDLRRLLGAPRVSTPQVTVPQLLAEEAHLETIRRAGGITYSVTRHIEVLIALMAEASLLARECSA